MALLPLTGVSEVCTVNTHTPAPAPTLTEADCTALPSLSLDLGSRPTLYRTKELQGSVIAHLSPQKYHFLLVHFFSGFISSCNLLKLFTFFFLSVISGKMFCLNKSRGGLMLQGKKHIFNFLEQICFKSVALFMSVHTNVMLPFCLM